MIKYTADKWGIFFAFKLKGSVFPKSFGFAFACAALSVGMHMLLEETGFQEKVKVGESGLKVLASFTFVLGFLLVFRTQQAYARWWEGGTLLQELRGEWFNAYSCLLAFGNPAKDKTLEVAKFQHQLARLMSMLYGAGLAQVSSLSEKNFEVLDLEDFDDDSLRFADSAHDVCEVVLQWIQRLIVEATGRETIKVAPPILSRVYNQLGNGIVKLNNARKITNFPIPFPFAQMITVMLLVHWVTSAVICSTSIESPVWAGLLSFAVVLSFWSINFIALELEDPFGDDANDLPIYEMQTDLNSSLKELLNSHASKAPDYNFNYSYHSEAITYEVNFLTLSESVGKEFSRRDKDCHKKSEDAATKAGRPPPTAPPPKAAAPAIVAPVAAAPPPVAKAASSVAIMPLKSDPGRVEIDVDILRANTKVMESHLESCVAELISMGSNQTAMHEAMYQLHCDLFGWLSSCLAKMPQAATISRQMYTSSPLPPEIAPAQSETPQPHANGRPPYGNETSSQGRPYEASSPQPHANGRPYEASSQGRPYEDAIDLTGAGHPAEHPYNIRALQNTDLV